ncbi:hypothetical protein ACFV5G_08510 [Streptomyces sp. NPDC059766]|uniref:hypothetical protein n=1 Tax=Streptomyces sp. NPDC059766 TaxID=3346940 RepID=UPI00365AA1D7
MGDVLADLCDDFFGMCRLAERRGMRVIFDEIVEAVRDGRRPDTARLDELFSALGLHAHEGDRPAAGSPDTRTRTLPPGGVPSVAAGSGHVTDRPYVCPLRVCHRAVLRRAGQDAPTCDIGERPLVVGR